MSSCTTETAETAVAGSAVFVYEKERGREGID